MSPRQTDPPYAELAIASNFSFLHGASHPEEIAVTAAQKRLSGFSVTDRNTFAGVVRAHMAARETQKATGLRYVVGCRLVFLDDTPDIFAWPRDRAAYGRLSRLLTVGNRRAPKGECHLTLEDLLRHGDDVLLAVCPDPGPLDGAGRVLARLKERFADHVYLGACLDHGPSDKRRLFHLDQLAEQSAVPLLALGNVLYHDPARRPLQDVLTCVREHVTLDNAGRLLQKNAERHIRTPGETARLFRDAPHAVAETVQLLDRIGFSLDDLAYEYPEESCGESATPQAELQRLTALGLADRYPDGAPQKVEKAVAYELGLIEELQYAPYFLTVHDIVRFARSRGILCQGRGSAANSAVCFCLGITEVDPDRADLLFERFISPERREPPDIDVDFEHERREEVIQYIYQKYGRDRAGLAATVITYRSRSAIREVGKAFGLSEDAVSALAGNIWGWSNSAVSSEETKRAGLDPSDPLVAQVLALTQEIIGFPRHLSQHVGGFVITRGRLDDLAPVQNAAMEDRTIIEWDKDDLDGLGILKIDILALGMLSCIRKAFDFLRDRYDTPLTIASIPPEEDDVYDMICRADTLGVFQIESRAQMSMLPRLRPRTFYDLVSEVAIVRPGPIQGDMVHPYLRRRSGLEPEVYPAPDPAFGPPDELRQILGKTKGVPLFQEQAMRIAMVAAKFSDADVNELRKAMATFRKRGTIGLLEEKMVEAMVARGYDRAFAARCFNQIKGFGEYGFPESHAASFAHLVYVSSWLKCAYPDVFCCALLNSQPMGFYAPAQIVRDACEHGVEVRAVDVSFSDWDSTLEVDARKPAAARATGLDRRRHEGGRTAVRLGLRQVDGLVQEEALKIVNARAEGGRFADLGDLKRRARVGQGAIEKLAAADAFRSMGLDRRQALWEAKALGPAETLPLFAWTNAREDGAEPEVRLPEMALSEHVVNDYQTLKLSLKAHPLQFLRARLDGMKAVTCAQLRGIRDGGYVKIAGAVLVRQRPGSAKGVVFMTIEDETGVANAVIWPKALERFRKVVMASRLIMIHGRVQRHEDIIHVVASRLEDRSDWLMALSDEGGTMNMPIANADEVLRPGPEPGAVRGRGQEREQRLPHPRWAGHPRNERIIPKSRDFH